MVSTPNLWAVEVVEGSLLYCRIGSRSQGFNPQCPWGICFSEHMLLFCPLGIIPLMLNAHISFLYHFFLWHCGPARAMASFFRFLDHTKRLTIVGRTPLDEWSARRRDLYLTTHNSHMGQTSIPPAGFETAIPASERPQTDALDRADTGIGPHLTLALYKLSSWQRH